MMGYFEYIYSIEIVRIALLTAIVIGGALLVGFVFRKIVIPLTLKLTSKTKATWDDILLNKRTLSAASHILPAIVMWIFLPMVFSDYTIIREVLIRAIGVYITLMSVNLALSVINSLKEMSGNLNTSTQQYIISLCGVLKIIIIFIAVIIIIAVLINRSPAGLLAGLGATSAVLMLVFKDTILGLVAGIRLTSNDMVHKGDWVTVPTAGANGIVEAITLTTVKIRNFDNTIVTVPPTALVDGSFINWVGMQKSEGRRVNRKIYFDFRHISIVDEQTKERLVKRGFYKAEEIKAHDVNLTLLRNYIERYLATNEDVNAELPIMVRQLEATETGLPVEFYFFLKDKAWIPYEHKMSDILNYIYAVIPEFGLRIYQRVGDNQLTTDEITGQSKNI